MANSPHAGLALPVGSLGTRASGWWGMMALIVTEGALFAYLLFVYFYLDSQTEQPWPPEGLPELLLPSASTVLLLAGSVLVWLSEKWLRQGLRGQSLLAMAGALLLGLGFVYLQYVQWLGKPYGLSSHLYGSLYFTITGFHLLHVAAGILILAALLVWIALGYFDGRRRAAVTIGAIYWHFVNAVGVVLFFVLYLSPYL